jgi:hypothetical protein
MYNLQVASNEFEILKAAFYRFYYCFGVFIDTTFFSELPESPSDSYVVFLALISWRLFYVKFFGIQSFSSKCSINL